MFLLSFFYFGLIATDKNIASAGEASQSDNYNNQGLAYLAIDGNTDGHWGGGSVTHTVKEGNEAWWRLDFSNTYYVSKILIWNRVDCCSERLNGVTVRIDDHENIIAELDTTKGNPIGIEVDDDVNKITIYGGNSVLSLAEVEVFGEIIKNIAIFGMASQSDNLLSVYGIAGIAGLAIDGNTDGDWGAGSVTHTNSVGKDAWWRLEFSNYNTHYVSKMKVWNRVDCCSERLNGVTVRVDDQENILAELDTSKGNPIEIKVGEYVNFITIYGGNSALSLAEVEVFGPISIKNIAREGSASQSDNADPEQGHAGVAIDGNTDGNWGGKSVTHTSTAGKDAWWRLDFPNTYYVYTIRIWNRLDCCSERLNGATVRVDNRENILAELVTSKGNPIVIKVDDDVNFITIYGGNSVLSLAEVEVFGYIKIYGIQNIASEGKATQSDNLDPEHGHAGVAIDGNTDGNWGGGSVTHTTTAGKDAWWRLDFPNTYYVYTIRIWNREDCCSGRLNGATVSVDNRENILAELLTSKGNPIVIKVDDDVNFITIYGGNSVLSLAEVEVFGYLKIYGILQNIASEGKASQSDNYDPVHGHAEVAIDGNTDGNWGGQSVTHTTTAGKDAWWRLDYPETKYVSVIRIWNRVDCCSSRVNGATVTVDGQENILAELDTSKGNPNEIKVNGDLKSITIYGGDSVLSLAEVEVFGTGKYFYGRRIDEIFIIMTHNSLAVIGTVLSPNQNYFPTTQFRDGVRGFGFDLYMDGDNAIETCHGGCWDPEDEIKELVGLLEQEPDEFIIIQLESYLTDKGYLILSGWFGGKLVKNFNPAYRLGHYLSRGEQVLILTDKPSHADPSIGIHDSQKYISENQYDWHFGLSPPVDHRRGPQYPSSETFMVMINSFKTSVGGTGNFINSQSANSVGTALFNVQLFEGISWTGGKVNIWYVDYYEFGDIFAFQHIMRNGGSLEEGDSCPQTIDRMCQGSLECGKRTGDGADESNYICCKDTYVPFGWTTDVCVGLLKENDPCPSTFDNDCQGTLECGKRTGGDADESNYICCKDTYVPFGWTTDVCVGLLKENDPCPSTLDNDCEGNLECGKRTAGDADGSNYICCKDTYVPSGWTTDVCVGILNENDPCPSTLDNDCEGDLECGKRTAGDADGSNYICCKDTYVPFGWTTDVCVGMLNENDHCPSTKDNDCSGSLECGQRSRSDSTYVCCHNTYVVGFRDVCKGMLLENEECPSTNDNDCNGSLECGQRSRSDSTYVCCQNTYVHWFSDICQ